MHVIYKSYKEVPEDIQKIPPNIRDYSNPGNKDFKKVSTRALLLPQIFYYYLLIAPKRENMISRSSSVVTGLSLQTKSTFSGGLISASGKSPTSSTKVKEKRLSSPLYAHILALCIHEFETCLCHMYQVFSERTREVTYTSMGIITHYYDFQKSLPPKGISLHFGLPCLYPAIAFSQMPHAI